MNIEKIKTILPDADYLSACDDNVWEIKDSFKTYNDSIVFYPQSCLFNLKDYYRRLKIIFNVRQSGFILVGIGKKASFAEFKERNQ